MVNNLRNDKLQPLQILNRVDRMALGLFVSELQGPSSQQLEPP